MLAEWPALDLPLVGFGVAALAALKCEPSGLTEASEGRSDARGGGSILTVVGWKEVGRGRRSSSPGSPL